MKILLTGAGGLLGRECVAVLGRQHETYPMSSQELDITELARVEEAVARLTPQVVLNCAAFAHVDLCESERERAYAVNARGPRNLAQALAGHRGKLIHISTDYVFDGQKPPPEAYAEDDQTNPLSWYGKTKREGEAAVQEVLENHAIIRTAWLYGIHGQGFLNLMLDLAVNRKLPEIRVVDDQFGTPTWAYRLAQQLAKLIEADARGMFHATAEGRCSRNELARFFLEQMQVDCRIVPCSSTEFPTPAVRPKNSILENHRLKEMGLNLMQPWKDDLAEFAKKFREQLLAPAETP